MWPARLVRSLFLVLREREFVTATRALGGSQCEHHHPPYPAQLHRTDLGQWHVANGVCHHHRIRLELSGIWRAAAHAHLGKHSYPQRKTQVFRAPWLAFYPGLMIFITVMAINYIGDGLRDAFDPYVIHTGELVDLIRRFDQQTVDSKQTKEKRMKLKLLTLFVVFGLVLSACGGGTTPAQPPARPAARNLPQQQNLAATEPARSPAEAGGGTVTLIIPKNQPPSITSWQMRPSSARRRTRPSMTGLGDDQ